jgi:hypothetical protein
MAQTAFFIGFLLWALISFENNSNIEIQITTSNILNPIKELDC